MTPEERKIRQREWSQRYRQRNREKVRQANREAKRRTYQRDRKRHKEYMAANPEKKKAYQEKYRLNGASRASRLKSRYGITNDDFDALLGAQNNCCAVCGREFKSTPYVDHDHVSGKVRGLVHRDCNTLMGLAEDNPEILEAAAQYLRQHQENDNGFSSEDRETTSVSPS